MRSILKKFALIVAILQTVLLFSSCGTDGELLMTRALGEDMTVKVYGGTHGVRKLVVLAADGSELCRIDHKCKTNEPYSPDDGEDYGFSIADLDFDGIPDLRVVSERNSDGDVYACYISDGAGDFKLDAALSSLRGACWDAENETVSVTTRTHTELVSYPNAPPIYTDETRKVFYGRDEDGGKLEVIREETLTYYSETEIYCYAIYEPNEDGELEVTDEHWILPDKLDRFFELG